MLLLALLAATLSISCISYYLSIAILVWLIPTLSILGMRLFNGKRLPSVLLLFNIYGMLPYLMHAISNGRIDNLLLVEFLLTPSVWLRVYLWIVMGLSIIWWPLPNILSVFWGYRLKLKHISLNSESKKIEQRIRNIERDVTLRL